MGENEREFYPSVCSDIAGLLFLGGFMGILASPLLGIWLAIESLPDGWSWKWFVIGSATITATLAALSLLLVFIASAIWRWKWGFYSPS